MASDLDIAWLAGLVEGEGCFTLHTGAPYFLMDMTDKDVLEKAAAKFPFLTLRGPYIHKTKPQNKERWRVDAFGPKAVLLINLIYTFLGQRRQSKINELLSIYKKEIK